MKNFFKTKKGVKTSVGIVAALVAVVSTISIMVPSYVAYKKYYDAAIAEREHQKYLNSLPLEFSLKLLAISMTPRNISKER